MRKRNITLALCLLAMSVASAQTKSGGISKDMLQQIESAQSNKSGDRAIFNAMAANSIDNLAKNFKNQGEIDTYFSVETPSQSIHDQKS